MTVKKRPAPVSVGVCSGAKHVNIVYSNVVTVLEEGLSMLPAHGAFQESTTTSCPSILGLSPV